MGALGFILLCLGCLATGATRHKVYRAWRARIGGRISCAVVSNSFETSKITPKTYFYSHSLQFMAITYVLSLLWLALLCFLVIVTFLYTIFWMMCTNPNVEGLTSCIDFTQFCQYYEIYSSLCPHASTITPTFQISCFRLPCRRKTAKFASPTT